MTDIGAITPATTNLTLRSPSATEAIDHSYTRTGWASGGADVATVEMSFDDFLDMVNPFQHIPVLSSVTRAITGDSINPVSRIAGDTLYGGVFGLAAAGLGAIGAIGDEIFSAHNAGQGVSATMVASLFGPDEAAAPTQLAATQPSPAETALASAAATPAVAPMPTAETAPTPPEQTGLIAAANPSTSAASSGTTTGLPLDRTKAAYGGVSDTALLASAQQNQALALAMAGKRDVLQAQKTIRNSRFAGAAPAAAAAAASGLSSAATSGLLQGDAKTQAATQSLIQELQAMKGVSQYQNAAQSTPAPANTLNVLN